MLKVTDIQNSLNVFLSFVYSFPNSPTVSILPHSTGEETQVSFPSTTVCD